MSREGSAKSLCNCGEIKARVVKGSPPFIDIKYNKKERKQKCLLTKLLLFYWLYVYSYG